MGGRPAGYTIVYNRNHGGGSLLWHRVLPKSRRRESLLAAAEAMFAEDFAERVLAFDSEAARAFARIAARRRAVGKPISHADAQIAAIVQVNNATLATRNVGDFDSCGIRIIDPLSH